MNKSVGGNEMKGTHRDYKIPFKGDVKMSFRSLAISKAQCQGLEKFPHITERSKWSFASPADW